LVRVDDKTLEAEVAEQEAAANNIVALAELTQSAFDLGVVVAAIIILIAFRVEVNLRHSRSLKEDSS
jgi:DNA helicase HerA-like ATPase